MDFYADKLRELLYESHPDFVISMDHEELENYIKERADLAAAVYSDLTKQGVHSDVAMENAMQSLNEGFLFSKFDTISEILQEYYTDIFDSYENAGDRLYFILDMTLKCEIIFEKYIGNDETMPRDMMETELIGFLSEILENHIVNISKN